MRALLTPDGVRVLVARKLDNLRRGGQKDLCANGDLRPVSYKGKFQTFLSRRDGFDEDTSVRLYLKPRILSGHVDVKIDSWKYDFSVNYSPGRYDVVDDDDDDDDDISELLEIGGMSHILCEDFDKSSNELQYILHSLHFMQLVRRCVRCACCMSTPHQLCMQCDCETVSTRDTYFCTVCQAHTSLGDVIVTLACNHHLHAECAKELNRCPVCRKGCRSSATEFKVCR